jgi:hypothetical protein
MLVLLLAIPPATASSQGVPTRTVARPSAVRAEPFSEIRAIRELTDGRVIVVDGKELTVQLVDIRAGTAKPIGRTGEGPGEYRWPGTLYVLPGDSTLLHDHAAGRLLIIGPDGKPGDFLDLNRASANGEPASVFRFAIRSSDDRGRFYAEGQPTRVGSDGQVVLSDSAAIIRLDRGSGRRDTVAMLPVRRDANARIVSGMVITQPRLMPFPAWDHWLVSGYGRVAMVTFDPYRVTFVNVGGRTTRGEPIPFTRVPVDNALKEQYRIQRSQPQMALSVNRGGASTIAPLRRPFNEPTEWPDFLPPYLGSAVFASDGLLWIPRAVAAGRPPLYDIIDGNGRLVERVELPARHKLVGFGKDAIYLVRLDEDDLQYLQRHPLPTSARP